MVQAKNPNGITHWAKSLHKLFEKSVLEEHVPEMNAFSMPLGSRRNNPALLEIKLFKPPQILLPMLDVAVARKEEVVLPVQLN